MDFATLADENIANDPCEPAIERDQRAIALDREQRELTVGMSGTQYARLHQLAERSGTSLVATVFAAFCALVYRYTDESICTIGVSFNAARDIGTASTNGAFDVGVSSTNVPSGVRAAPVTTNMHVLQVDLGNDPTFEELLRQSNTILLGALGNSLATMHRSSFALGFGSLDTTVQHRPFEDIWTVAIDDGHNLTLEWTTNAAAFERATIERMAKHFACLLQELIAHPDAPISRAPLMDDEERQSALNLGRGKQTSYERTATIHALVSLQAQRTPNAIAVVGDQGVLAYAELERRANRLAHYLRSLGVRSGTPVGVSLERSLALPVALLAILKTGAHYVALDATYPRERLEFIVGDAGVALIVTEAGSARWGIEGVNVVDLNHDAAMIAAQPNDAPVAWAGPDALAYVSYTSGSTGRPKGVAVKHRGVVRLVRGTDYIAVRGDDVFVQLAPVAFDASTFELWAPLLNGARVAIPPPGLLSMAELGDAIARFGVTVLFLTTSLFQKLVDSPVQTLGTLRLLLTGGEVASPRHMLQFQDALPSCVLMAVYGPTENTTFSTWCELSDAAAIGRSVPIGRPIANSSAHVLDRHGEPVPIGAAGELWVGGDGVAQGYVNLPELTRERFVRDPFSADTSARLYRTGDRARMRPDGVLEFLGRNDDQVKIRGHRVELGEIESVLQTYPAVRNAAVVVAQHSGEKSLVAFVMGTAEARMSTVDPKMGTANAAMSTADPRPRTGDLKTDFAADERALRGFLTSKLPAYMLPNRFEFVDRLPQHPSGKLDRIALARMASAPTPPAVAPGSTARQAAGTAAASTRSQLTGTTAAASTASQVSATASALQESIATIWRDVLGSGRNPGSDENFFDAGGDSLRLLTVHDRLQREFAVKLRVVDLFEHSTIRKLAGLIGRSQVRL